MRLYFKLLIWFLAGLIVMLGAEALLETTSLEQGLYLRSRDTAGPLAFYSDLAREALARGGTPALKSLIERIEDRSSLEVVGIDSIGGEFSGEETEREAREAGVAALRANSRMVTEDTRGFFVGYPIGRAQGRALALVMHPLPSRPSRAHVAARRSDGFGATLMSVPYDLAVRAFAMLIVGGVACFLLARHLTIPVMRLQQATRRLAAGDLAARVGPMRRRPSDELEDLGKDFDRMAVRLEALVTAQRRLLSDISHELRSPLARMNVALALLRQQRAEDRGDMLARLETEAGRLNRLIGELLTLSRVEGDMPETARRTVDLGALAAEIAADASFETGARSCEVRLACPGPILVSAVPELLRSAIENVVRNAVRYTREGSTVEITIARREGPPPEVTVEVRDHGPGLPEDEMQRIFEPFYRVEHARERSSGGAGLGLAIAQRAVAQHGGAIAAAPAPGGGLVVTIHLPAGGPA